jgi:hypothetical protein
MWPGGKGRPPPTAPDMQASHTCAPGWRWRTAVAAWCPALGDSSLEATRTTSEQAGHPDPDPSPAQQTLPQTPAFNFHKNFIAS